MVDTIKQCNTIPYKPLCRYFNKCGGCTAQHIDYHVQLDNKRKMLFDALKTKENCKDSDDPKINDFKIEDIKVFSDEPYYYRNRMDMIFHNHAKSGVENKYGKIAGLGFREKGNWKNIIDVDECKISNEKLNELIKEVREFFGKNGVINNTNVHNNANNKVDVFDIVKQTGTFKYALIRTPQQDSAISFVLNKDSTKIGEAQELIKEFAKQTTANNILITFVSKKADMSVSEDYFVVKGRDVLEEMFLGKTFLYSIQGFFQNNSIMAEKMHKYVHALIKSYSNDNNEKTKTSNLLDLYGGVGTFGIINADLFNSVLSVESFQGCTDASNENIRLNKIENAKAICLDAKNLKKLKHSAETKINDNEKINTKNFFTKPLFVITDPPRSGMHPKTILELKELKSEVIIYISCNLNQLKKDLPKFKNYNIKSAALFDLFPQTLHAEGIVELVKYN
ncbi:MAG: hypothetical protein ABIG89_06950 [Candidatus Woesearchaeota archaeon]